MNQTEYDQAIAWLTARPDAVERDCPSQLSALAGAIKALSTPQLMPIEYEPVLRLDRYGSLDALFQRDRYNRHQKPLILRSDLIALKFGTTSLGSGSPVSLSYPLYKLLVNGVERARYTRKAVEADGLLAGALVDEPDGVYLLTIQPCFADGTLVTDPIESWPTWYAHINRYRGAGGASQKYVIAQNGTFDLTWPSADKYNVDRRPNPPRAARVLIPMARLVEVPSPPRAPRNAIPFTDPLTPLTRINYVPPQDNDAAAVHIATVTRDDIVVLENIQTYHWSELLRKIPRQPMKDGPPGVCTSSFHLNHILGRHGKVLYGDPWSWGRFDPNGYKTTYFGLRSKLYRGRFPRYYEEATLDDYETVGIFEDSIPLDARWPAMCWKFSTDTRSVATDPNAAPRGVPLEQPHLPPGPKFYFADEHQGGRIGMVVFPFDDPRLPPNVPAHIYILRTNIGRPWGSGFWISPDGQAQFIVNIRDQGRMRRFDVDNGMADLPDVISHQGPSLGYIDPSTDSWTWTGRAYNYTEISNGTACAETRALTKYIGGEGLAIWGNKAVCGSRALGAFFTVDLVTGAHQWCGFPVYNWAGNAHFINVAVNTTADGFGPDGRVAVSTFDMAMTSGWPQLFDPIPNVSPDGTPLTHKARPQLQANAYDMACGAGGRSSGTAYPTCNAFGSGMMSCGNSMTGLDVFAAYDKTVDRMPDNAYYTQMIRGAREYRDLQAHLLTGQYGRKHTDADYPASPNIQAWLRHHGMV